MSSILLGLTVLIAAYLADLMASHWGLHGKPATATQSSTRRSRSRRPNGQPSSRSPQRRTGIRSP